MIEKKLYSFYSLSDKEYRKNNDIYYGFCSPEEDGVGCSFYFNDDKNGVFQGFSKDLETYKIEDGKCKHLENDIELEYEIKEDDLGLYISFYKLT